MVASNVAPVVIPTAEAQNAGFLTILPKIRRHAEIYFRQISCADQRDDKIAETIALAWRWFIRLAEQGKDATRFPMAFATLVARSVRCGRRLAGGEKAKDVMSRAAQRRHGFVVGGLPDCNTLASSALGDALTDNTRTPPAEQAAFRIDFPGWRSSYCERDRRVIDHLMMGERTKDVSKKHGLSPGRISQKRRQFQQDWLRMHGEVVFS